MGTFLFLVVVAWLPAELCRNFAEYSEPWHSVGFSIRRSFGRSAPFYEHIASGAGLSFGFGAVVWLLIFLAPLLKRWFVPSDRPLVEKVQAWLLAPPYKHQEILVLMVAPLPALWWSLEWELGQASGRFKGGNTDESIQFCQIGADLAGIVVFVLICLLVLFPLFRRTNAKNG